MSNRKNNMRKDDIVKHVARQTGIDRADTEIIINATLEAIKHYTRFGKRIDFRGFGYFYHRKRKPTGRDMKTNKQILLPDQRIPMFKPSKLHFTIHDGIK
jgi:DNA-binding protein HU-beta